MRSGGNDRDWCVGKDYQGWVWELCTREGAAFSNGSSDRKPKRGLQFKSVFGVEADGGMSGRREEANLRAYRELRKMEE
jgi:hypothetical protein